MIIDIADPAEVKIEEEYSRRGFIKRLGILAAGALIVPYIPKTFYSIPAILTPGNLTEAILSNYDETLKRYYLPAIQEQLNYLTFCDKLGMTRRGL